jgi:hypothetical protein
VDVKRVVDIDVIPQRNKGAGIEGVDRFPDRLEPVAAFLDAAREAGSAAGGGKDEEKRDRLKKLGSNRRVLHGELVWEPRGAWQLVAKAPP